MAKWLAIPGSDTYEISDEGVIRNAKRDKVLIPQTDTNGYFTVNIHGKRKRVHRLMLETWKPRSDMHSLCVDHINFVKNDNRLCNLRWVTPEESCRRQPQNTPMEEREAVAYSLQAE